MFTCYKIFIVDILKKYMFSIIISLIRIHTLNTFYKKSKTFTKIRRKNRKDTQHKRI